MWRVLTHERNRATLAEVEQHWSLPDLAAAHLALDVHDELAERQAADQRQKLEQQQRRPGRRR